jgi:hypothetical protein
MELTQQHNLWMRMLIYTFGLFLMFDYLDSNEYVETKNAIAIIMVITVVVAAIYLRYMCKTPPPPPPKNYFN